MTFYWRQTIVGLLHHAAADVPWLAPRANSLAGELNRHLTAVRLEEAFALFQEVTSETHDPVYVTGAFYTMQALKEAERWERQGAEAGRSKGEETTVPRDRSSLSARRRDRLGAASDDILREVEYGLLEMFDRLRGGASLDQALALFPLSGEESNPEG